MNSTKRDNKENSSHFRIFIYGILFICAIFFTLLTCFLFQNQYGQHQSMIQNPEILPNPSPPDLSCCTRLDVSCAQPILKHLHPLDDLGPDFFNDDQMEYLQSTKNFVIEDKDSIKQIAQAVSLGKYKRGGSEEINAMMVAFKISVAGYRNDEHITTINMYQPSFILDEKNQRFDYDNSLPDLLLFVPENIKPAILRVFCARNLWFYWEDYKSMVTMQKIYPIPSKWCDMFVERKARYREIDEKRLEEYFKCPSASGGKCNYAMNMNDKPNSPGDMVLLFETKDGWNRQGGPELFSFDNHEPKGGCVLLNDGNLDSLAHPTTRFIRTKEELNKLRWK